MYEIRRRFRFYGAHRNTCLPGKCTRIHGHTYQVDFHLRFEDLGADGVCLPFEEIDSQLAPLVEAMDHRFLIWEQDPFLQKLRSAGLTPQELEEYGLLVVPFATSAESLAHSLYHAAKGVGLPVAVVKVRETPSSEVTYYE